MSSHSCMRMFQVTAALPPSAPLHPRTCYTLCSEVNDGDKHFFLAKAVNEVLTWMSEGDEYLRKPCSAVAPALLTAFLPLALPLSAKLASAGARMYFSATSSSCNHGCVLRHTGHTIALPDLVRCIAMSAYYTCHACLCGGLMCV